MLFHLPAKLLAIKNNNHSTLLSKSINYIHLITCSNEVLKWRTHNQYCYTSDSLWIIWLVESIQSIHNSCELDMINAISAADIAFIMSSSTSAWLLSPLECSPQKQNGWMLRFCFWGWIMWKMYNKAIIKFGFRMISWIIKTSCLCYLPQPSASADNTYVGFDNSWYHAQPHPIIIYSFNNNSYTALCTEMFTEYWALQLTNNNYYAWGVQDVETIG